MGSGTRPRTHRVVQNCCKFQITNPGEETDADVVIYIRLAVVKMGAPVPRNPALLHPPPFHGTMSSPPFPPFPMLRYLCQIPALPLFGRDNSQDVS